MKTGLFIILCLHSLVLYGQEGWLFQNPLPGFSVSSAQMIDNETIYMCGYHGLLKKSTDGGNTWSQIFYQTTSNINQVYFTDINKGYIVTADSNYTIAKTTNAGITWESLYRSKNKSMLSLYVVNENIIYAGGTYGGFVKTTNGGYTWSNLSTYTTKAILAVYFLNENIGYIALSDNSISKTTDGGLTWVNTLISNYNSSSSSLYFFDNFNGWYLGNGKLYKTTDAGNNWFIINNLPVPQISNISSFQFFDKNYGLVLGSYEVFKTTDGGLTWTTINISVYPNPISTFSFFNEQVGIVLGYSTITTTSDGGTTWEKNGKNIISEDLVSTSFLDENDGWILTAKGKLLKTHNGGNDWETSTITTGVDFYDLLLYSSDSAWALQAGTLYRTVDGGNTWSPKIISGTNMFKLKNSNLGWVGGYNIIYKTTNSGSTWASSNPYPSLEVNWDNLFFVNSDVGFASYREHIIAHPSHDTCAIIKTTDGGISWSRLDLLLPDVIMGIYFLNDNTGWVADYNSHIFKTTDGGQSWSKYTYMEQNFSAKAIAFVDSLTGYAVGKSGLILKTSDGGLSWKKQFTFSSIDFVDLCFVNSKTGWVVGNSGTILKTIDGGISDIKTDDNSLKPNKHFLNQNYPNPFNPNTTISFSLPKNEFVSLKIFDILGREVTILINEELSSGIHSKQWNANNLSSGIYFYTLKAGNYSATKKMILIK